MKILRSNILWISLTIAFAVFAIYLGYFGYNWANSEVLKMITWIEWKEQQGFIVLAHPDRYYMVAMIPVLIALGIALECFANFKRNRSKSLSEEK